MKVGALSPLLEVPKRPRSTDAKWGHQEPDSWGKNNSVVLASKKSYRTLNKDSEERRKARVVTPDERNFFPTVSEEQRSFL